jgi:hypothetical protein
MFNFFKKNQDEPKHTGESSLTYYVKDDGEIFCDINLIDYSDKTLQNFAKILVGISSLRFQLNTIEMVQSGFLEADKMEECVQLLSYVVQASQDDIGSLENFTTRQQTEEEPCIKPSDML